MPERPKRIQLKGEGHQDEGRAIATITPGHLIKLGANSEGASGYLPHDTAGAKAAPNFALEDALQGRTIDDDYEDGELVTIGKQHSGDRIFAWLASGEVAEAGDLLTSNGDGTLKVATGSDHPVATALEAIDASDSASAEERIRVEIV